MDGTKKRRLFGGVTLGTAMLMLFLGMTILKGRLNEIQFLLYWSVCLVVTGLSMVVAFLDLKELQRRTRDEQRNLMEDTLKEISDEARSRVHPRTKPEPPAGS